MSRAAVILGAAILAATPVSAQVLGASELDVGVPIKGAPSPKPVADIYYLAGESGAKETYTLTVKGPATLTLFGPDGSEILTVGGAGTVKLEAVLPFTDVFTLAVARKTPSQPYTLTRKTTVPTLAEVLLAGYVGYTSRDGKVMQCWVIPGVKLRMNFPDGANREETLAADRTTISYVSRESKGTFTGDMSARYADGQFRRTWRNSDGKTNEVNFTLDRSYNPERTGSFAGYRCDD